MKKLILMLLLCIPSFMFAKNDLGEYLLQGKYTVTFTGETLPLTHRHILPNVQSAVVIEFPPLPDTDAYYDFVLSDVSDNASISWFAEPQPNGRKCSFSLDTKPRFIWIQVLIRTGSSYQEIIDGRTFEFVIY